MRGSKEEGQIAAIKPRVINPADVALPPRYKIEMIGGDLTFPTIVAFDNQGRMHVIEAGYSYGEVL
jgi:hypothetical protein